MSLTPRQVNYVDKSILHPKVKRAISSKEEYPFKKILNSIGKENKDWFHQHPFYDENRGLVAVPDFVFIKEKVIIELDGESHKNITKRDVERDSVFSYNGYYTIRIKTPIDKDKINYWVAFIKESLKINLRDNEKKKKSKKKKKLFSDAEFEKALKIKLNKSF